MQRIYFIPFLFLVLLIGQMQNAFASHTVGADLTFQCLGGEQYQLTLSFYRDCSGINAPSSADITIKSTSCGINTSITLSKVSGTGNEITPICPTAKTTCSGGTYTGIEEYVYTGTFTLPTKCDDWVLSFQESSRNAAISTISSPSSQDLYVEAHLDNLNVTCNSSPTFSNKPVPFICVGDLFCFNHGAIDVDGDSLVYSLTTPMNGANSYVNYTGTYSATNPLKSSPALTFDAATGDFCVTPTQKEVTVVAVLVEEYRNGVLIGSVTRDMQLTVEDCNNANPSVDGINGTGKFDTSVCAGTQLCFVTNSSDSDAGQSVTMSWNSAINGATFNTSSGSLPKGTFCWTPKTKDISTTPKCFTVEVKDDNCPYNGLQTYSFCITVSGLSIDAGSDQSISCTDSTLLTAKANGGSGNYAFIWSTGDSTQTTTAGEGMHYLNVDDGAGCIGTDSVEVTYYDAPVSLFTLSSGCSNPVTFTDASTISGGPTITAWDWDFGDGNTSNLQNPSNNFSQQGTYTVALIVTSSLGCSDTSSTDITINSIPLADFSNTTVCEGQATNFTDLSTVSNGNLASWLWDFGDGNSSSQQNPTNQYANAGTYNVTLTVTTDSNCSAQSTYSVDVSTSPVPAFSTNDICLNETATFTDNSSISSGTISNYLWDLGDATTSTQQSPTHSFTQSGTYTVKLITVSNGGCSDSVSQNITVYDMPSADFSSINVCLGLSIPFSDLSTSSGSITNWEWNFSNGMTSSEQSPNLVFPTPGQITAELIITDNNGCTDTTSAPITVFPLPNADYSVTDVCLNDISTFNDLSSIASGSIVSWQWDFNDGNTSSLASPSHTYAVEGTYTTKLLVTSDNACEDSIEYTTNVNPLPQLDFTPQTISGCEDLEVNFSDLSSITTGSIASYNWSFGDGGTSTSQSPTYIYTNPGVYSISLTATSDKNCTSTLTNANVVTVYSLPVSQFDYSPQETSILYPLITFDDASSIDAISWLWDFGDGTYSSDQFPTHAYSDSGTYTIELLVVNSYGCLDSIEYDVRINPDGILFVPNTFTPNNDGLNDSFVAKGFGILDYEMRIFNRWGDLIYSCADITKAWDGSVQSTSQAAPEDVYVYHISVRLLPDKKHTYIGRVTLVR